MLCGGGGDGVLRFAEGVLCAEKDTNLPKHPDLPVPNLQVRIYPCLRIEPESIDLRVTSFSSLFFCFGGTGG